MTRSLARAALASAAESHPAAAAAVTLPVLVAIKLAAAAASWLTDREIRNLPFGNLAVGTRQRRADQATMHGTFILAGFAWRRRFYVLGRVGTYLFRPRERGRQILGLVHFGLMLWFGHWLRFRFGLELRLGIG